MNNNQHLRSPFALLLVTLISIQFSAKAQTQPFSAGTPVTGIKIIFEDVTVIPGNLNTKASAAANTNSDPQQVGNKLSRKASTTVTPAAPSQKNTGVLYQDADFFNHQSCARLTNAERDTLAAQIKEELMKMAKSAQLLTGFGLHSETNIQLGEGCIPQAYFIGSNTPQVTATVTIPRVRLFARITTPDGVSGALDPNFVVYFDLVVTTSRLLPTHTSQLGTAFASGPSTIQITNISEPETNSVTGNLLKAANRLIDIMGGPDFIALLRQNDKIKSTYQGVGDSIAYDVAKAFLTGKPSMRIDSYTDKGILVLKATNKEKKSVVH